MSSGDDDSRARQQYAARTAALVGERIREVTYWDIHNFGVEPRVWDHGDWHHAVMGVDLRTDAGRWSVLWTNTFHPYGVEVLNEPLTNHLQLGEGGCEGWRVEDHPSWRSRVGTPVLEARTFWEQLEIGPTYRNGDGVRVADPYTVHVPVALRLDFQAGPVWMVAAIPDFSATSKVFMCGDEIMVIFSAEGMHKIGFPRTDFLEANQTR